ncbi:hypothetical protein NM688_g34 [Phlebia brevispora]|uniref:Uncharacterized protein n=1 Tax=Phlebia brevispora TaxID=194682 RepID=A0ACC1TF49_9APHY|nr:hypothetical protein NM688_g34 [Phlebia brevispora]
MSGLLIVWSTALLYGMNIILTAAYMRILLGRGLKLTVNRILFTVAFVQFSLATAQVAVCLQEGIEGFLNSPNPAWYFADASTPLRIAQLTLTVTNTLIADSVLIVIVIIAAVCGYADVIILTGLDIEQQLFSVNVKRWAIAAWSTSIGAEMSSTLLIAWKLWFTYTRSVGAHHRQHLKSVSVMLVILESGAALSTMRVFLLVFYVKKMWIGAVVIVIIGQMDTLVPTSIFVRLASTNEAECSRNEITSSRFRTWLNSARGRRQNIAASIGSAPIEALVHNDHELYELHKEVSDHLLRLEDKSEYKS